MKRILPPRRNGRSPLSRPSKHSDRSSKGGGFPFRKLPLPELFVGVKPKGYSGPNKVPAQIKVRRKFYRYLVWTEDGRRREFYLGKIKILAPTLQLDQAPAPRPPARSSSGGLGGKKKARSGRA